MTGDSDADASSVWLDRSELAEMAGVSRPVVDLVIDAGLLAPAERSLPDGRSADGGSSGTASGDERFGVEAVEMLTAARTFVSEGVALEELTALAMRHAAGIESVVDDAIELCKRHVARSGRDRAELAAIVRRLVPVATELVARHFERTLTARAMARLDRSATTTATGVIVVCARRLDERIDPLAVYAAADSGRYRSLWLRPSAGFGLAAVGAVDVIEPSGRDRFSLASAARAMLESRVRFHGPDEAPAPVLSGGFSFAPSDGGSDWPGFGDCRLVLPEFTVIDRADGTWVSAAGRVGPDDDEETVRSRLRRRLTARSSRMAAFDPLPGIVGDSSTAHVQRAAATAVSSFAGAASDDDECDGGDHDDDYTELDYTELAASGVEAVRRGEFRKVVLARTVTLDVDLSDPVVMAAVLDRLGERNPTCAVFAFAAGESVFFGATPEELVTLADTRISTTALAGTAARGGTPGEDELLAARLVASPKNRAEHRFVVDGITEALAGLGLVDPTPERLDLLRLDRLQHLRTPITARARHWRSRMSDMDVLRLAGALHPTPAVGGMPTEPALDFIARHEGFDRGWYAGPVGWCELGGNGELWVALRCGLARPGAVRLFAGAGVVADSSPADELEETKVKLRTLLDVMSDVIHGAGGG